MKTDNTDDEFTEIGFLAVLIYEDGNYGENWCCEEPRAYFVSHPEIAYRLALADGDEQRYGRTFLGLARLEITTEEIEPIARTRKGEARALVVAKEELEAFRDPRWKDVPCDEGELAAALSEPPSLFEIDGLDQVPWHEYAHAYGAATEVAKDIRRLTSTDPTVREQALWQLGGSIYHQGSIYGATAVAVPFLVQIVLDHRLEGRAHVGQFLAEIAKSCAIHPDLIRKKHDWRKEKFGPSIPAPSEDMIQKEIADVTAVHQAFLEQINGIRKLTSDADVAVCMYARAILELIEAPLSATVSCSYCRGTGACRCKRSGSFDSLACKRCNGSGQCHVCHGSGSR